MSTNNKYIFIQLYTKLKFQVQNNSFIVLQLIFIYSKFPFRRYFIYISVAGDPGQVHFLAITDGATIKQTYLCGGQTVVITKFPDRRKYQEGRANKNKKMGENIIILKNWM